MARVGRQPAGSRLDAAKRLARQWVDGLDRSDAVALWVLTDKLEQPVPVAIANRGYFFQQLDAWLPAEGSASLAPVFNAAREWAETRSPGRKELVVITDNQPAAWDWPAEGFFRSSWRRGNTHLVVLAPDSLSPSNLSVAAVEWGGKTVREGALLTGAARLENHGSTAASDLLECRCGERVMLRGTRPWPMPRPAARSCSPETRNRSRCPPVSAGEEARLPAGRMATRILTPAHPLFDGVWSERMPFPPLPQRTARRCAAADGGRVLATLAGEYPLLVEARRGLGWIYWVNASADRGWGDLPLSPVYVALAQPLARAGDLALQTGTSAWVGESWPVLSNFGGRAVWSPTPPGEQATRVLHSGVFDALANDRTPLRRCAVNVRRAESELRPLDPGKLRAMLPGRLATGTGGIREWREAIRREVPLWPWLLAAAALVFIAEGWFSTRAAARRGVEAGAALPRGLERRNPR